MWMGEKDRRAGNAKLNCGIGRETVERDRQGLLLSQGFTDVCRRLLFPRCQRKSAATYCLGAVILCDRLP